MNKLDRMFWQAVEKRGYATSLSVYRLVDGQGDGLSGLFVDRLGSLIIVHVTADSGSAVAAVRDYFRSAAEAIKARLGVTAIYLWHHERDPRETTRRGAEVLCGVPIDKLQLCEGSLAFLARPRQRASAGVFIDMREVRLFLQENCRGKRVLNTFAFTGLLGTAAACGAAEEVVQVDISKTILAWAKENCELNREAANTPARFICEDTRTFMEREVRRLSRNGKQYDVIVIDPPSFGSSSGKAFSFEKHSPHLLGLAGKLLSARGVLIFTCNNRQYSVRHLESMVRKELRTVGRKIATIEKLLPPAFDFTSKPEDSLSMRGVRARLL